MILLLYNTVSCISNLPHLKGLAPLCSNPFVAPHSPSTPVAFEEASCIAYSISPGFLMSPATNPAPNASPAPVRSMSFPFRMTSSIAPSYFSKKLLPLYQNNTPWTGSSTLPRLLQDTRGNRHRLAQPGASSFPSIPAVRPGSLPHCPSNE